MSKTAIIIKREYISRVKKKSFIILTIVGPVLFAALMLAPIWMAMQPPSTQYIAVIDDSKLVEDYLKETKTIRYAYPSVTLDEAVDSLYKTDYTAVLWVPENVLDAKKVILYFKKNPGIVAQENIRSGIENILYENQLEREGIDMKKVDAAHIPISIVTQKQHESGQSERTNTGLNMGIGFGTGILIYLFIFLYGVQVMRGVIEEKTSRIVEVIISSVKPFQLMLGKIVGIAMVGLTQFILWSVLTFILVFIGQLFFIQELNISDNPIAQPTMPTMPGQMNAAQNFNYSEAAEILKDLRNVPFLKIIFAFIFYFLGGYLLYSAMFAAIGAAVDNEADTQQFMAPVTIPLVFAFIAGQFIIQNPEGPLSFWLSIIPFTSPVVMMVRLPFEVPLWELLLSMALLVLGFIFMTWLAGKIYRTGILMYGKKVTYKELWKWLRYSG